MDVRNLDGKTAVVTGAASGIGKETALAMARRGADLALCDIDERGLRGTKAAIEALGCRVLAHRVDVADRTLMANFAEAVHAQVEAVDVLVNNAGVAIVAPFLDTTLDDWDWIVGINLKGVVHGLHYFVPPMVQRGKGGHVVNISSGLGLAASGLTAAYSATKFAVVGLSEALRTELAPSGIGVTAICPGLINTPIIESSVRRGEAGAPEVLERLLDAYGKRNYGPDKVARKILKAIQRDRAVVPVSAEAYAIYFVKRFAPGLMPHIVGLGQKIVLGR